MKKIFYIISVLILVSCTPKKMDYQIVQDSETLLDSIAGALNRAENPTKSKELEERYDSQYEIVKSDYARYMADNINSQEAQEIFSTSKWTRRLDAKQLETALSKANPEFKGTELYANYKERLTNMNRSVPYPYKEIISKDTLNNEIKLSDYIGQKIVLLDFWASWCPPCRAEMPALVELYNQYKGDDFEIVGYSLDNNEESWKKGLNTLNMTWPQMSDLQGWNASIVQFSYVVQSIPCMLLIDRDGQVIARGFSVEELKEKLDSLNIKKLEE